MTARDDYEFFLGGRDLEMLTIRELLDIHADGRFHDRSLLWGDAKASVYSREIERASRAHKIPVLLELEDDIDSASIGALVVDHHGVNAGAGAPTALEQVFELLGLPRQQWTRRHALVAANDRGHIDALLRLGATQTEIESIRSADRAAQGITPSEEAFAREAVAQATPFAPGALFVVLPHSRTAAVMDRLHPALGGKGYDTVLIASPSETNVFAQGWLVKAMDRRFPGGWLGGDLPRRGFWGIGRALPEASEEIAAMVQARPAARA